MAVSSATKRTRRTPINGTRDRLTVRGKDPDYVYRIVNDIDDRVQTFQEMGYEIVTDDTVVVGDKRVANPTKEGSPVKVSVGQGVQAYVMRQKKEWYEEDQRIKQAQIDELENSMKSNPDLDNNRGKLTITRD